MITLTSATQALLSSAFSDLATASEADSDLAQKQSALVKAQADVISSQAADIAAHSQATKSAHDAIQAVATELNFQLPGDQPVATATPA